VKPETYRMLAHRQDRYWWHRARRSLSRALLAKYGLATNPRWLDLGCGPGGNLGMLDGFLPASVVGFDLSPLALELAREATPEAMLVGGDLNRPLPFHDGSFDLVTIYNVLYHQWIESETAALREVYRVLAPGGLLLLTEPAFPELARGMDVAAMARRRYSLDDFQVWMTQARLLPVFSTYFTSFGYPLLLAAKRLSGQKEQRGGADMRPIPVIANMALLAAARIESTLIRCGARMPFGTTLLAIARRPA
jgi:SAM-dependent methyltransferase